MKAVGFHGVGGIRAEILTHVGPLTAAVEAYKEFDPREPGWIKVKLEPLALAVAA